MHVDGFAGASSPACRASSKLALRLSDRRRVLVHSLSGILVLGLYVSFVVVVNTF
jgi:hypothetical protein